MKKRFIALAGGAALLAAAAVPVGSAFAQPSSRTCQKFLMAAETLELQFSKVPETPQTEAAFLARLDQIEAANAAAGCPPFYFG